MYATAMFCVSTFIFPSTVFEKVEIGGWQTDRQFREEERENLVHETALTKPVRLPPLLESFSLSFSLFIFFFFYFPIIRSFSRFSCCTLTSSDLSALLLRPVATTKKNKMK